MLVSGGLWDQPFLWQHLEMANYIVRCYRLKKEIGDVTRFMSEYPDQAAIVIECDRELGLI